MAVPRVWLKLGPVLWRHVGYASLGTSQTRFDLFCLVGWCSAPSPRSSRADLERSTKSPVAVCQSSRAMESEAAEVSPSPSATVNPGNRLKNALTKARRDRANNASKVSVTGTDNSSEGNGTGVRNSIESLIDKSRQSSLDDGSSRVKLAKLIPGLKKRKKKRQEAAELAEQQDLEEEGDRGRRHSEQPATAASLNPTGVNESHSSLGDEENSLMTVDSDTES